MAGNNKREDNKQKRRLYIGIIAVLLIILIVCVGVLIRNGIVQRRAEKTFEDLANASTEDMRNTDSGTETEKESETEPETEEEPSASGYEIPEKNLDWEALRAQNEHIYAWIYIPDTNIDYPVLQHPTELNYYLDRNLDGSSGYPGCIYTQNLNDKDFMDPNTILYGHNMKNGSMFQNLHNYEDSVFFDENRYAYIYTPDETYVYEIFAAYDYSDKHLLYSYDFETPDSFDLYLDEVKSVRGMSDHIREESEVNGNSHVITLSTCISGKPNNRWLVQAVMLNDPTLSDNPSDAENNTEAGTGV